MEKCVLRWHKGSIIELHLDGYYAYGQLLRPYHVGFYDKKFDSPITDVKQLKGIPFLFIQLIYPTAVYDGLWKSYLRCFTGIDFLNEFYEVEHTQSIESAVDDLQMLCYKKGGRIV